MPNKITGVLVNVNRGTIKKLTIEKSLEGYYKALGVTCIDIVSRYLCGKRFDIICDDEALMKDYPIPSAYGTAGNLYGNLFVVKTDGNGNEISLTASEIKHVLDCSEARHVEEATCKKAYYALFGMTF